MRKPNVRSEDNRRRLESKWSTKEWKFRSKIHTRNCKSGKKRASRSIDVRVRSESDRANRRKRKRRTGHRGSENERRRKKNGRPTNGQRGSCLSLNWEPLSKITNGPGTHACSYKREHMRAHTRAQAYSQRSYEIRVIPRSVQSLEKVTGSSTDYVGSWIAGAEGEEEKPMEMCALRQSSIFAKVPWHRRGCEQMTKRNPGGPRGCVPRKPCRQPVRSSAIAASRATFTYLDFPYAIQKRTIDARDRRPTFPYSDIEPSQVRLLSFIENYPSIRLKLSEYTRQIVR